MCTQEDGVTTMTSAGGQFTDYHVIDYSHELSSGRLGSIVFSPLPTCNLYKVDAFLNLEGLAYYHPRHDSCLSGCHLRY